MGKKKGKGGKAASSAKRAERKARQEAKMAKKSEKKAKKQRAKEKKARKAKGGGDDMEDLEAILKEFEIQEQAKTVVEVTPFAPPPGPRSAQTIAVVPSSGDFLLFGGERYDGKNVQVFNDMYMYNPLKEQEKNEEESVREQGRGPLPPSILGENHLVDGATPIGEVDTVATEDARTVSEGNVAENIPFGMKDVERLVTGSWTAISSPNMPKPRCGHQSVIIKDTMYTFGGEFTAASGLDFHHWRDLWSFDIKTKNWEKIVTKTGPSARSGHRMVAWKNFIVLFGGFYEAYKETRYFNDLWVFDIRQKQWHRVDTSGHHGSSGANGAGTAVASTRWPSARGGSCFFAPAGANARSVFYLYGGYSTVSSGKKGRSKGVFHTDLWELRLSTSDGKSGGRGTKRAKGKKSKEGGDGVGNGIQNVKATWERIGVKGKAPSRRSGMSYAVYKNKAYVFGGVVDQDEKDDLSSRFYNDLHSFDMDKKRWFSLSLRDKKKKKKKKRKKKRKKDDDREENKKGENEEDNDEVARESDDEEEDSEDEEEERRNVYDELEDDKFYYLVDGELVALDLDSEDDEDGDGDGQGIQGDEGAKGEDEVKGEEEAIEEEKPKGERSSKGGEEGSRERKRDETGGEGATKEVEREPYAQCDHAEIKEQGMGEISSEMAEDEGSNDNSALLALQLLKDEAREAAKREPRPRMSATVAIRNHSLYVFGGVVETGSSSQLTLDDIWSIDLNKLEEWNHLVDVSSAVTREEESLNRGDAEESDEEGGIYGSSVGRGDGSSDEEADSEDASEENGESEVDEEEAEYRSALASLKHAGVSAGSAAAAAAGAGKELSGKDASRGNKKRLRGGRAELNFLTQQLSLGDEQRTPKAGEALKDFFLRTADTWVAEAARELQRKLEVEAKEEVLGLERTGEGSGELTEDEQHDKEKEMGEEGHAPLTEKQKRAISKLAERRRFCVSGKELRRIAFSSVERRYKMLAPLLRRLHRLEQEQKEREAKSALEEEKRRKKKKVSREDKKRAKKILKERAKELIEAKARGHQ